MSDFAIRAAAAVHAVRRMLPYEMQFRLTWARALRRPDYLVLPKARVVREVLGGVFQEHLGYPLNLDAPQTFSEKLQWRKVHDRRAILPVVVDKYRARDYVSDRVGTEYLIPLLHVSDQPAAIPWDELPVPFIIKPNNGSGSKFIVRNLAAIDRQGVVAALSRSMQEIYGLSMLEWAYSRVPPRIVIEQLLLDQQGLLPKDFKFHVFGGRVEFLHVDQDREVEMRTVTYDRNWQPLSLIQRGIKAGIPTRPPAQAAEMIALAERLAADLDYARVDLYNLDGRIYFGEITLYPDSGLRPFEPGDWDRRWGALWTLPPRMSLVAP